MVGKKNRPRDINQLAARIVSAATDEEASWEVEQPDEPEKDPAAVALGRKGGKKGGKARAVKLTPERRSEIARLAARARWEKSDD